MININKYKKVLDMMMTKMMLLEEIKILKNLSIAIEVTITRIVRNHLVNNHLIKLINNYSKMIIFIKLNLQLQVKFLYKLIKLDMSII